MVCRRTLFRDEYRRVQGQQQVAAVLRQPYAAQDDVHLVQRIGALPSLGNSLLPHKDRLEAVGRQIGHILLRQDVLRVNLCMLGFVVCCLVVEEERGCFCVWHGLMLLLGEGCSSNSIVKGPRVR
jgi:hypothetical protein